MEEEVHGFASDAVDVLPATRRDNDPYAPNGSGPQAFPPSFMRVKKNKKDIAEPGMEPNVHWFASDQVDVLPATRRDDDPYDYNGTSDKAFPPSFLKVKKGKNDIAEPGMEPNVHWFASDQVDVLPATRRDNEQYAYNGSGPQAFPPTSFAHKGKGKKDIAEPGMEPNVHWFASDQVDVLPATRRDDDPYEYNGVSSGWPASLAHKGKGKKDIAEPKMDEEVHGFASDNVDVLPATRRDDDPYAPNGSGPQAFPPSFMRVRQGHKAKSKDIAEPNMDEEVHGFASDAIDVLPATRRDDDPYDYNGSGPLAFPPSFIRRQRGGN